VSDAGRADAALTAAALLRTRSFRFQWPADLAASCAFEMEVLVLSWYVLTETGSVVLLTLFASLQYLGTLFAPMFGVIGSRIGNKELLCMMRGVYLSLAGLLLVPAFAGALEPWHVFLYAAAIGLVRPSDAVMRIAIIGDTVPPGSLLAATGLQRTTYDAARIFGYLSGAAIFATLGIEMAIFAIASLYACSVALTLQVASSRHVLASGATRHPRSSAWRDLSDTIAHVQRKPALVSVMCLAFLVNMTAFPLINGLLPVVARDMFGTDQTGLGYLAASFAFGALVGSLAVSRLKDSIGPERIMFVACGFWYLGTLFFSQVPWLPGGMAVLVLIGFAQSLCIVPMSVVLLRESDARFRSGVLGVRALAVYGVPFGLLLSGPLIELWGYSSTAVLYCGVGLCLSVLIYVRMQATARRKA